MHNYSFDDRHIIIKNSVQVSYLTDLDFALEIMKNVGKECPFLLKSKEIRSRVVSFDDSGITLMSVCWIKNSYDNVITSYSIHYTKLYESSYFSRNHKDFYE